eukprot:m.8094 g.8094  ORF g.8094 m.8094 type:complete len:110 (+) comp5018_c0_seq1:57-386(+)
MTELHQACADGIIVNVLSCLRRGDDKNATDKDGNTPLHLAAKNGRANVVKALLEARVKPDIKNKAGYTPAQLAEDRWDEVAKLIQQAVESPAGDDDNLTLDASEGRAEC